MRNGKRFSLGAALLVALTPGIALGQEENVPADSATMGADVLVLDDLAERLDLSATVREQIGPHVVALSQELGTLADLTKREMGQVSETERTELKAKIAASREAVTTHKRAIKESLTEEQREAFGAYLRERAEAIGVDLEQPEGDKMMKKEP